MNRSSITACLKDPQTTACEKALFVSAALTFFCLPLGTAPLNIAAALCAAIWLFSGIAFKKRNLYLKPYWWPVFGLILLPWIGMLYTLDSTGVAMDYAKKTHYWLFAFAVAAIAFRHLSAKRLVQAFMLGLGVNVLAAICQIVFHLADKGNQHRGLGPDYSTLSAFLIVGIMMGAFFLGHEKKGRNKLILSVLVGLYLFHLLILRSRASYVAFVMLIPVIGYTFFKTHQLLKTVALCVLIPALMMASPVVRQRVALSIEQLSYHMHAEDDTAWGRTYTEQQDRFYMWNGALRIIAANPLLGVGTGGYSNAMFVYGSDPDAPLIAHPHNNFLYMTVSFGMVGLAVFIWFLAVTLTSGWCHRQTAQGYMLFSVVAVLATTGLFNTQILDVGTASLLSLTVGLIPALKWSNGDA